MVFGSPNGFDAAVSLATLDGSTGFRLDGVASSDRSGSAVSAAGDVNDDGVDDLLIGAPGADSNNEPNAGSSYVVFGQVGTFDPVISLSTLDGSNGFRLDAYDSGDRSGVSVSGAGDVNGDGIDDLIIGADGADVPARDSGNTYVVFGRDTAFEAVIDPATLDGVIGFRLDGGDRENSGNAVAGAGDINGDGIDDLIVGAYSADPNGLQLAGRSYVVFGRDDGFDPVISLPMLNGNNGFRLDGAAAFDNSGAAVSAAGDVNGDGIDDLIIGAYGAGPNAVEYAGSSYVVFGRRDGFEASINLSTLSGDTGIRLDGVATQDFSGRAVSGGGDFNGDGFDDLVIGARNADPAGSSSGSTYVVFGQRYEVFKDRFEAQNSGR